MNKVVGLFAGLTALVAMGSAGASTSTTCPITPVLVYTAINDATGHIFDVFNAEGVSWATAEDCANDKNVGGVDGHLATITSESENKWVIEKLLTPSLAVQSPGTPLLKSQVWVGGVQDKTGITAPGVGDGWRWVNNEGPFSGSNGNTDYTNWANNEPNDGGSDLFENSQEDHLTLGRFYAGNSEVTVENRYVWNDEGVAPGSIGGFIVEYDVPRAAACDPTGTNLAKPCQTIDGQTLVFPPGSFDPGETIKFTSYEFTDPRVLEGKCTVNRGPLTLFTDAAAFGPDAQLRIPSYLCGSPRFVVVKVDSSDLDISKGTVDIVNKTTETVLPTNLYKCWNPILRSPVPSDTKYFKDPQYQDVVVWQSTNPAKMLENDPLTQTVDFNGAATEVTNGCGSSTGKSRGASYFVIGLHVDFGAGFDYETPANRLANYNKFVALTRYKLTLLKTSIAAARSDGALRNSVSTAMDALIGLAIYRLDRGNPAGALIQVRQFLWLVNAANYTVVRDVPTVDEPLGRAKNYNGEHLMRGENIAFTLQVKVVPYKPVP